MLVHEAMTTPRAEWVTSDITLKDAAQRMRDQEIGCLPIGEEDRLVGMLTDRDLACRAVAQSLDAATTKVADVMTKGITYCNEDHDLEEALEVMEKNKIRRLPVINENKRMVGILSLGDISHAATRELAVEMVKAVSAHH